jgi:hypothetical protein
VRFAPRYDVAILDALSALDDRGQPIAEISRRVGVAAERLGFARPSYVHLRRLVHLKREQEDADRARREEIRAIVADVAGHLVRGHAVNAYEVADRVREAGR